MADKMSPPCSSAQQNACMATIAVSVTPPTQPVVVSSMGAPTITTPHTTTTVTAMAATMANNSHPPPPHVHQTMAHPHVPPSPIPQHFHCPQVQVIQQPIHSPTYLPQMYNPQHQQLLMPGNITMSPSIQVIAAGKTCVPNQLATQMIAGKPVLQGQSTNYIPTTTNQTLVIGQLGMLPSQSPILSQQHAKQMAESQKVRPYVMNQAGAIQSKSPILPHPQTHTAVTMAGTQVLSSSQFKQLTSQGAAALASTPQLITSQAPGAMIASQSQIINSLQAISTSLPPGLTWTTHGGLQSHAVITAQNPIFIRSNQQQDMFIQSSHQGPTPIQPQPGMGPMIQQHPNAKPKQVFLQKGIEFAPNIQPKTQASVTVTKTLSSILPSTVAPIRPASSVATQTNAMAHGTLHPRPQIKQRAKSNVNRVSPGPGGAIQMQQKADAANQTRMHMTMPQIQPKPPMDVKAIAAKTPQPQNAPVATTAATTTVIFSEAPVISGVMMQPKVSQSPQPSVGKKAEEPMDTGGPIVIVNGKDDHLVPVCQPAMSVPSAAAATASLSRQPEVSLCVMPPAVNIVSTANSRKDAVMGVPQVPVMLQPPTTSTIPGPEVIKDKQGPQKAIVKPHVLTHVIEGFVIQEAPEPFPVNRSSLLAEYTPSTKPVCDTDKDARLTAQELAMNDQEMMPTEMCNSEQTGPREVPTESWAARDKRHEVDLGLTKCEFCGKPYVKPRSKRFCSTSCAKRFNVGCTKRLGLFSSPGTTLDSPGKYSKKKKHGIKMRKGLRKIMQSKTRIEFNTDEWSASESPPKEETTNSSNSGGESSLSPTMLSSHKDVMEVDTPETTPNKNPLKWTVPEVFEFIKALPGCADYADEFRLQEIDGQALLLLKEDHLMTAMNMKLGPALKICARINSLKEEVLRQ